MTLAIFEKLEIHAALLLAYIMFGLGAIVGALGLPATNPLTFTFVREIISGMLLLSLSSFFVWMAHQTDEKDDHSHPLRRVIPQGMHMRHFALLGLILFINQGAFIVGIQLAGPVTGSVWQPSTPVLTACVSMLFGWEAFSWQRCMGVCLAFGGCATMVLLSHSQREQDTAHGGSVAYWIGNVCFLSNCLATSCFILLSKPLLLVYPSLTVIAWTYLLASVGMFLAATLSSLWEDMEHFICPACIPGTTFQIPTATLPALAYYILAMSVGSWGLLVWCNQYATGTLVVGYSVVQPVISMMVTAILLYIHWVASCTDESIVDQPCLNEPGAGTLVGMLGVACGLGLVIQTEPKSTTSATIIATKIDIQDEEDDMNPFFDPLAEYGTMPLRTNSFI